MTDMIPEDASVEGAPTLAISDRELVREVACSYKAIMATQYLTDVLEAIQLGDLLQKLAETQTQGEDTVKSVLMARDLKEKIEQMEQRLEDGKVPEQNLEFWKADIERKKETRLEILSTVMQEQQASQNPTQFYGVIADSLPIIFKEAPELVYKFCALMMTPNTELEEAYRKGGNRTKKLIEENQRWLMFHTKHWEPLEIATFYLPAVGLDVLKKVGTDLITGVATLMVSEEEESTSSDTSSRSSSANLELVETN